MIDGYERTSKKGDYSELLALARLVREGYDVAIPYGNQAGWDLLVEIDGKWEKWQVKTARRSKPGCKSLRVPCKRFRSLGDGKRAFIKYEDGDFDILLAVQPDTGWMWKIPFRDIKGRDNIYLPDNSEFRWHNKEPSKFFLS